MKAIQFKKTGHYVGNHDEVTEMLGGSVIYVGQRGKNEAIKTYERDNRAFPLQFNDWVVELTGVILVLDDMQYQALVAETAIPKKQIGRMIHDSVKAAIEKEQKRGGIFARNKFSEGGFIKDTRPYISLKIEWPK